MRRYLESKLGFCVVSLLIAGVIVVLTLYGVTSLTIDPDHRHDPDYQFLPVVALIVVGILIAWGGIVFGSHLMSGQFSNLPGLPQKTPDAKIPAAIVTRLRHQERKPR